MKHKELDGRICLVLTALLWSLNGILIKSVSWSGLNVAIMRGAVGAVFMLLILRKRLPFRITPVKLAAAACHCAQGILLVIANKYTTAANAVVLQNMSLFYIIIGTSLMTRRLPRKMEVLACLALFVGVVLTAAGNMGGGGSLGNLLAMLSALFYAGVFFFTPRLGEEAPDAVLLGSCCYFLMLPLLIGSADIRSAVPTDWICVTAVGITCSAAWLFFAKGIKTTPALEANFITMLEPVLSPVWTFLFLQEKMTVLSLVGSAVVIVTLIVYNWQKEKNRQKSNES